MTQYHTMTLPLRPNWEGGFSCKAISELQGRELRPKIGRFKLFEYGIHVSANLTAVIPAIV